MSEKPPAGSTIPDVPIPRCPYCQNDLTAINGFPFMIGPYTVLTVACANCRTLLHMQIFQNPPQDGGPRVQIPQ
jgi:hypothetical protein